MTDDEAKTKWCPFSRTTEMGTNPPHNRVLLEHSNDALIPSSSLCIGSACMAWRRTGEVYLRGNVTEHQVPDGGYCGLAGRE